LNANSVGTLAFDAQGNLWISTGSGAFSQLTPSGTVQGHAGLQAAVGASGTPFQIPTPSGAAFPPDALNLTLGPDGNIWFTETPAKDSKGNQIINGKEFIGQITSAGAVSQFQVPTQFAGTGSTNTTVGTYITAGADGNVWFVEASAGKVAKITPAGVITEFSLNTSGTILGLALGADGNIWVRDFNGKIYRVTPTGSVTTFTIPTKNTGSDVELVLAPDGALWFPEDQKIGRITTTGAISEFPLPTVSGSPNFSFQIAFAPNGAGAILEFTSSDLVTFTIPASASRLLSATLPASRSVQVGGTATAFATMLNTGTSAATNCKPAPLTTIPTSFVYQTTNSQTNALTGAANTPANIAAGGSQSFVVAFADNAPFIPTNTAIGFSCANADAAPIVSGLNTLLLSGSATPVPDVVALAASGDPGIVDIPGANGTGVFAVATDNVGASGAITATANTGSATLPVIIKLCQTNSQTGACLASPAASVATTINANATATFGIFVTGSGTVPFNPANNRVFVQFADSTATIRGETSVAVRTQ
jgi:streptogramin lyase